MADMDDADRKAAELLPCASPHGALLDLGCSELRGKHGAICWASRRVAVAAALRERDERIAYLESCDSDEVKQLTEWCAERGERIAALEAELEKQKAP